MLQGLAVPITAGTSTSTGSPAYRADLAHAPSLLMLMLQHGRRLLRSWASQYPCRRLRIRCNRLSCSASLTRRRFRCWSSDAFRLWLSVSVRLTPNALSFQQQSALVLGTPSRSGYRASRIAGLLHRVRLGFHRPPRTEHSAVPPACCSRQGVRALACGCDPLDSAG